MRPLSLPTLLALASVAGAQFTRTDWTTLAVGDDPVAVATGDVDGDGFEDAATANTFTTNVLFQENDQAGGYVPGATLAFSSGYDPRHLLIADLDGLNDLDVVVAHPALGSITIHRSAGYPAFQPFVLQAVPTTPIEVHVVDVDRDDDLDLAVLVSVPPSIQLFDNDGNGAFSLAATLPLAATPASMTVGNFNRGGPDFAVSRLDDFVSIYLNTTPWASPYTFAPEAAVLVDDDPHGIQAEDLDGDGYADFATVNGFASTVSVMLNEGPTFGGWPTGVNFLRVDHPLGVVRGRMHLEVGDFQCDGDIDLAVGGPVPGAAFSYVEFLANDSAGAFSTYAVETVGGGLAGLATVDQDEDWDADLVTANTITDDVTLLENDAYGVCVHEFRGGIQDGFAAATPVGTEDACPSGDLAAYLATVTTNPLSSFDVSPPVCNRYFAHSFDDLPGRILAAELEIGLGSICGTSTDGMAFGLDVPNQTVSHSERLDWRLGTGWATGTITHDLSDLWGLDLLPKLNADGRFDLYVQDDTDVDHMALRIVVSMQDELPRLTLDQDPLITPGLLNFQTSGAGAFDVVVVLYSFAPLGGIPGISGLCLQPNLFTMPWAFADAFGDATTTVSVSGILPPCTIVNTQAVAFPTYGLAWSNTITAQLFD